jgi:hypothetical protein
LTDHTLLDAATSAPADGTSAVRPDESVSKEFAMDVCRIHRRACDDRVDAPPRRRACLAGGRGIVLAGVVMGCAGVGTAAQAAESTGAVVVPLAASAYNAGRVAQATLLPQGSATRIVLWVSGVPGGTTLPPHLYTYIYEGTCDMLPAKPAMSLNDRVLVTRPFAGRGPTLSHTAALSVDELLSGRYALALRSAPADGDRVLYCGALRRA